MLKFYYIDDMTKQQCGPFGLQELQSKYIRPDTLVWRSGMPDWMKAESVRELACLFDSQAPIPEGKKAVVERPISSEYKEQQTTYSQYNQTDKKENIGSIPKNWMLESVLLSVVRCSPISVVGIYFASKVEDLYLSGNYEASQHTSNLARNWALLGALFLPACYMLFVILVVFTGMFYK